MTMNEKTLDEGHSWVDAVQQPNLAAGGNGGGGGGTYRVTIPHGTYGSLTYTTVGVGGGNGGGSDPPAEPTDPPEQQALPSTPIAIAVFVLVFVLTWAALKWL